MQIGEARVQALESEYNSVMRSDLCNTFLIAIAVLTLPLLVASASRIPDVGLQPVMVFDTVVVASCWVVMIFRKRLPLMVRSFYLLLLIISSGLAGIWQFGLFAGSISYLIIVPTVGFLFFGERGGALTALIIVAMSMLIANEVITGQRQFNFDSGLYHLSVSSWVTSISCWTVSGVGTGFIVWTLHRQLVRALGLAQRSNDDLEAMVRERTRELSETNAELERQIRERRQAEDTAARRQNELTHVSRVNSMGELAASLAHEINQPLTAISNYATGSARRLNSQSLSRSDLDKVLGIIAGEAERAGELIRWVRSFVRREDVSLERENLNELIGDTLAVIRMEADRRGVGIDFDQEEIPDVRVNRVQIEQVMVNLLNNAMDALEAAPADKKTVTITTRADGGGGVVCSVADRGAGLSGKDSEQVFEAFYTTKASGMGMGLAISRTIIEDAGGRMWAEADPEQGAAFSFRLPGLAVPTP